VPKHTLPAPPRVPVRPATGRLQRRGRFAPGMAHEWAAEAPLCPSAVLQPFALTVPLSSLYRPRLLTLLYKRVTCATLSSLAAALARPSCTQQPIPSTIPPQASTSSALSPNFQLPNSQFPIRDPVPPPPSGSLF